MLHNVKLKQSSNHGKVSKTLQCLTCRFLFHLSLPANLLSVCRSQFKQWSFSNCFTHPVFITRTVQRDACQSAWLFVFMLPHRHSRTLGRHYVRDWRRGHFRSVRLRQSPPCLSALKSRPVGLVPSYPKGATGLIASQTVFGDRLENSRVTQYTCQFE